MAMRQVETSIATSTIVFAELSNIIEDLSDEWRRRQKSRAVNLWDLLIISGTSLIIPISAHQLNPFLHDHIKYLQMWFDNNISLRIAVHNLLNCGGLSRALLET